MRQRLEALGIDVVVVADEGRLLLSSECGVYGCSYRHADGSGLASRDLLFSTWYLAVSGYRWAAYSLQPAANLAMQDSVRGLISRNEVGFEEFATPKDIESPPSTAFQVVLPPIEKIIRDIAREMAKVLSEGTTR